MTKPAIISKMKPIVAALLVNFLLSWTILPLAVPPFRIYTLRELMDVLLWQGIAAVGWPLAIMGGFVSLFVQGRVSDLVTLLLVLIYPTMLVLLIIVLFSKHPKLWMLIMLQLLLTISFAAIWHQVLNGYDFMIG